MKKSQKIDWQDMKARHDLDTLRETIRVEKNRQRMKRVRILAAEEITELAYAASLHVEISR